MGVWGLTGFLEKNCKDAFVRVNLRNLIEKYKRENNTDEAVIVLNLKSFRGCGLEQINWICGGQMKEAVHICQHFIRAFEDIGATLVFFDVGDACERRSMMAAERDVERQERITSRFDRLMSFEIENEKYPDFICSEIHILIRYIVKDLLGYDLYFTSKEVDEEVADYARSHNSFAIFGVDSDFIIYNAAKYYLSMRHFDLSTMTTMLYDTEALARYLNLHVKSLPLFASLVGNDVIRRPELEDFHKHICRKQTGRHAYHYPPYIMMSSVAKYVSTFPPGNLSDTQLSDISDMVFMDRQQADRIKESIESYLPHAYVPEGDMPEELDADPDSPWGQISIKAWNLRFRHSLFRVVYIIMKHQSRGVSLSMEDSRQNDLPMSVDLLRPLRRCLNGVLLLERPKDIPNLSDGVPVEDQRPILRPVYPPQDLHPGLLALWDEERMDIADVRWELFAHSVAPTLNVNLLKELPQILVIPAAILFYLRAHIPVVAVEDSGYLEDWELKALAVQAVRVETTELSEIAGIVIQAPYNVRAIRLASIFMRAVTQMLVLLAACGFPFPMEQGMPWHYFDGKMFHQTYKKMKAGSTCEQLCGDKMPLLEQLLEIVLPEQQA